MKRAERVNLLYVEFYSYRTDEQNGSLCESSKAILSSILCHSRLVVFVMSAIEEVLWNIFTFYSLNGNPKDPSKLHSMALLKMCKDIMALDQIMTESPITQADLHLIYTSVLRSPSKVPNSCLVIHFQIPHSVVELLLLIESGSQRRKVR